MDTENTTVENEDEFPGVDTDTPLTEREKMIAYYGYARGVIDGKGIPTVPLLAEAFSLYGITEGQGKPAQELWDPFIDSEVATAILAEVGIV